jgi:Glycogen recognition site of AMP-activated protein kinase
MGSATYWLGFTMVDNYDDGALEKDAAFAEQIAARLRAPETVHPSFERRLMDRVRAEGPALYPRGREWSGGSWWRTRREFRLSPLAGLALAAGISAIIAVSGIAVGSRIRPRTELATNVSAKPQPDTVQLVRFVFVDPSAASVEIVGDFNAWARGSAHLRQSGVPGVWAISVPLSPGRHEYAFIINGTRWVADPLAVKASDDFGTESSVIRVGTAGLSST